MRRARRKAGSSRKIRLWQVVATVLAVLVGTGVWLGVTHAASTDLQVVYGPQGLQRITYRGQVLADPLNAPGEQLRIWHMAATDLDGRKMTGAAYGWGENNTGKSWDLASETWTYHFPWGRIRAHYVQVKDELQIRVTEENQVGSGVIFQGATLYPMVLHFPETPSGFEGGAPQLTDNEQEPGVSAAEFGVGTVGVVVPNEGKVLYSGFEGKPQANGVAEKNAFSITVSSVVPDSMKDATGRRPGLLPGATDTFTVSIRFARAGVSAADLGQDAYLAFAAHWPMTLNWPDRRMIGTVYLASSPQGNVERDDRNPRRYFVGHAGESFDVRSTAGLRSFQARVLEQARMASENLRRLNAQAVITWDLEGEEYPQSTSYVCSPDQIAETSPEMESTIDASLPFAGMKLDDAYFKVMRDAGFRVGVCVRPQHFTRDAGGQARQVTLPKEQAAAELIQKMRYAHDRWGATVFYLDSTVGADGRTLEAGVIEEAAAALPDSLLIPEEARMRAYRSSAPLLNFLFGGETRTPARVSAAYAKAFSANLVNDVDPGKLSAAREDLTDGVRHGDVLMVHVDSWHVNNATVNSMYQDARDGKQ